MLRHRRLRREPLLAGGAIIENARKLSRCSRRSVS
jgi:uncharacterized coiled-coil protein SlyX